MTKELENKLEKIPVINWVVLFLKKIKIPGLEGMSLYDVLEMYFIGIIRGALTTRAGGIAFSFFMSIFPFLLFVLTLIPHIPIPEFQTGLLNLIADILPPKTYELVDSVIIDIVNNEYGELLSFGFLASIFLMTNGVNAIFGGFEYSYHVKEIRNIFRAYFIAMAVAVVIAFLLLAIVVLIIFFESILQNLVSIKLIENNLFWLEIIQAVSLVTLVFSIVSILYQYGTKNGKHSRFLSPGSIFTTVLSIISFYIFGFYVEKFSNYNELYGSIGSLLILMLFIWLNAIILLLGFELDATIYSLRRQNKTFVPPKKL